MCRHCAFWVKQACIWIAYCLQGKSILWKQKQAYDFRICYCHNVLASHLLQMGLSWLKLNAVEQLIAFFENSFILQSIFHWSSYFPFGKLKENKIKVVKCSVAKVLGLFQALTLISDCSCPKKNHANTNSFRTDMPLSSRSICWISHIQSSNYYCHMFAETLPYLVPICI